MGSTRHSIRPGWVHPKQKSIAGKTAQVDQCGGGGATRAVDAKGPTRRCGPDASSGFSDVLVGVHSQLLARVHLTGASPTS